MFTYFIAFYGLTHTTAINTGILQSIEPIFIVMLSVPILKHAINRLLTFLVLLGLIGGIITISPEFADMRIQLGMGDGLVLLAVFITAVYVTLSSKFVKDHEPDLVLFIQQFSSVIFAFAVAAVFFKKDLFAIPSANYLVIGLAGIVQFGLTLLCFFWARSAHTRSSALFR